MRATEACLRRRGRVHAQMRGARALNTGVNHGMGASVDGRVLRHVEIVRSALRWADVEE